MVLGRLAASIIAAIIVGWGWIILGGKIPMSHIHAHSHAGRNKWDAFRASALHDLMNAGGYLSMGAMVAALIKVTVPKAWFDTVNEHQVVACLIMGILAVVLSLCSEADAFIAASFTHVSPVAQLVSSSLGRWWTSSCSSCNTGPGARDSLCDLRPVFSLWPLLWEWQWGSSSSRCDD